MSVQTSDLLEGEKANLAEEAQAVLGDAADTWLDSPSYQLGGAKPRELISSGNAKKQQFVRDLLRAIKHGMTT
jgi:antitoxin Xre/MbcA/ParS-like protein